MKKLVFLSILSLICFRTASGQFYLTGDIGQVTTIYGNTARSSYKLVEPSSPYFDIGAGVSLLGKSQRTHGVSFAASFSAALPFDQNFPSSAGNPGNAINLTFDGLISWRYKAFSISSGLEVTDVGMTDDDSVQSQYSGAGYGRPDEWLIGVPAIAKFTFGPAGRAFVQGGGTLYVTNYAATTFNDTATGISGVVSNGVFSLYSGQQSYLLRVSGGYMFGHWGIRGNFSNMNAYFQETGVGAPAGFYDTNLKMVSGGVIWTLF